MPTIPRGFMPAPPAPVYFAPDLSGIGIGIRAGRQNALKREDLKMKRDQNALARQDKKAAIALEAERYQTEQQQKQSSLDLVADKQKILDDAAWLTVSRPKSLDEAVSQRPDMHPKIKQLIQADLPRTIQWAGTLTGAKPTPEEEMQTFEEKETFKDSLKDPDKVWMFNPKTGMKEQIALTDIPSYTAQGYKRGQPVSATKVRMNPATGEIEMTQGPMGGAGQEPTSAVTTDMQKKIAEDREAMVRVGQAISSYKPKYNTLPFRGKVAWESLKQRFGGDPDEETSGQLNEFKDWWKTAMRDYAIAIQALGKGNLTKNEQKLYGAGLPDPGDGIWPKEAPEVYWDALVKRYKGLNAAIARRNYYLNKNMKPDEIQKMIREGGAMSTDAMGAIIDSEGERLLDEYKKSGTGESVGTLMQKVMGDLARIFGIGG